MKEQRDKGWQEYHTIWAMLFIGWVVSYADRTLTGPVVTWMITNKVGFLQAASNPHALGGLLGSLFFAGYMLPNFREDILETNLVTGLLLLSVSFGQELQPY